MSDVRWDRIKAVFEAALAAPSEDRSAILDRACGKDAELRREVESLLDARTQAFVRTAGAARVIAESGAAEPLREQAGAQIGRYKLLESIGEGGFGAVWMAEQREPVKRLVALKVIKLGMDTHQVIARFEAERQALAMMDHPHIAKVFDAGATETGRPYFVMEYIKGVPICEYCDARNLDTNSRLALFSQVCRAIQHAHTKGIIHRDIKPSNVLITMHDGDPVPKVIDFGIAKATSSALTTRTLFTEHRQLIGTPAYMSPEQAEMSGLDIDTRSDVYSLGVLLYELLTGTTPFDSRSLLEAGFGEMVRIIREVEPPKPSTRLSALSATGPHAGRQRQIDDPRRLGLHLRGDLDWIVMKCLEKDRTRRYETAEGLAADIYRHLQDEPVTAGAPGAGYRLRKLIKRNRGKVLAAGVAATLLVLGVIGTTAGLVWALDERNRATRAAEAEGTARVAAQQNEQKALAATAAAEAAKETETKARKRAETINRFVTTAFKSADAKNAGFDGARADAGHATTILAAMENAIKDIDSGRFKDDPELEAELRSIIGVILRNNGEPGRAQPLLEQGLALREQLFQGGGPLVATSLNDLGLLCYDLRRFAEGEQYYKRALAVWENANGPDDPAVATVVGNLAALYARQGRTAEAEPLAMRALEIEEKAQPPNDARFAVALNTLSSIRYNQGRFDECAALLARVIAIWEKTLGPDNPAVGAALHNLATLQGSMGKHAEAEANARRALAIYEKANGPEHPALSAMLQQLASLEVDLGKPADAEPLQRRALGIAERAFGPSHPEVISAKSSLAALCWRLGELDAAIPLFEDVLQAQEAALGRQHPDTLDSVGKLGRIYMAAGRIAEAFPRLEEAARASKVHARLNGYRAELLNAYIAAADPNQPETTARVAKYMRERLADDQANAAPESLELAARLAWCGLELLKIKAWTDAEPFLREALAIRAAQAPDAWTTFNTRSMLGGALLGQGQLAAAEPLLLGGYTGLKDRAGSIPATGTARIPEALERLVRLYEAKGNEPEAARWRGELEAARAKPPAPASTSGGK